MTIKHIHVNSGMLVPPPKDHCQECAVKHELHEPHNKASLFYQMKFRMNHGRAATWHDAMVWRKILVTQIIIIALLLLIDKTMLKQIIRPDEAQSTEPRKE